ncbi:hypothetical protein LWI29_032593 [Acer saccharum]|uniref:Uncharacterized protein n=1 Tax=Acer saccharum TaxID=4024 RepID=A0AA39RZ95_ACESA|nr:hypothetical protein LWI29_032593 [Acer saccharum]
MTTQSAIPEDEVTKKRKGGRSFSFTKYHSMKTRNSRNSNPLETRSDHIPEPISLSNWNLEVEITKVIEKGVALGINFNKRSDDSSPKATDEEESQKVIRNQWNLEEEVTKIIEMGAALGFDFNGREVEVAEILARKETEDEERWLIDDDRRRWLIDVEQQANDEQQEMAETGYGVGVWLLSSELKK